VFNAQTRDIIPNGNKEIEKLFKKKSGNSLIFILKVFLKKLFNLQFEPERSKRFRQK
jgi:hypothetical protein